MKKNHDIAEVPVTLKHETDHAYLVTSAITGKDAWAPKSQCEHEDGTLQIPEWLAVDKELV
jgi:hypothetical protein